MAACQDNGDVSEIPQWKRELILRRRALARTLPAGNSSVQFTCPSAVAAVRQADVAAAAGDTSYTASVDAAVAEDFRGGGRAASSVGENMRLVELENAPGVRRPLKNGVSFDSNNSVDAVTYRSIMGEEKSGKKSCANRKMDTNNVKGVNLVLGENNNGGHPHQDGDLSDSSEELQYGPGIVKKLKSKYMSMTLRENKNKGVRPSLSQLRRATSLENMLDNEENETGKPQLIKPQHKFMKRAEVIAAKSGYTSQHQQRYRSSNRGNDSIKRARSVEALLRYDGRPAGPNQVQQPLPIEKKLLLKSLSKDDIIIVDKTGAVIGDEKPPVPQATVTRKKRPIMSQKNGLPPPDLVKQTLKIFEKSATSKANGSPPMAKLNINMANQHKPVSNKPLLSPKPSPEKIRRSPLGMLQSPKKTPAPAAPVITPVSAPATPAVDTERNIPTTKEPPVVLPPSAEAKRVPAVPSRVLPLDLKPVPSASSLSSPKSKSPSPMTHISVKTILTPTNGVAKTGPYVKPRTPSPGPLSPTSANNSRSASPIKAARVTSPVAQPQTPTFTAPKVTSPVVQPQTPTFTAPKVTSPVVQPQTPTFTAPKVTSPVVQPPTFTAPKVTSPVSQPPTFTAPKVTSPVSQPPTFPAPKVTSPVSQPQTSTFATPKLPSPTVQPESAPVTSPKTPSTVYKPPRSPSPVVTTRTPSPSSKPGTVGLVANGKPSSASYDSSDDDSADGVTNKKITRTSLENIRKGGSTMEFSFCGTKPPAAAVPKSAPRPSPLPVTSAPSPATRHPNPMSPLPSIKSPDALTNKKQIGVIRPIVNKFMQPPSSLTDREIEKNQINRVKSNPPVEQPTKVVVSVKPSEIVVGNVSDSLGLKQRDDAKVVKSGAVKSNGPGLWDNKWNQQNTMIFDFRNRAEPVPDYIENDGIILRIKREKIKPGDSGFIVLDPSLEESSTDCETDDFNCSFLGPPSPCNVLFEGDNIVINGKSSLRKHPKQRKLKITFNDEATERFEYPSESSLLNDMLNSASSASGSGGLPVPATSSGPTPGLPVPSGGSSLASYTSRVSQGTEDFQLGVSRTTPQPKPREPEASGSATGAGTANGEADNVAWSADTADDLLF